MAKSLCSTETSRIEQLPDKLLLLILPRLTNLAEIARTSVLSRRWRNVWHNIVCFDFDATAILPMGQLLECRDWYVAWVNKVIETRVSLPRLESVKELRIKCRLDATHAPHIDRWIDFITANQVETLYLEFGGHSGLVAQSDQYKLSEDFWYRAPSGMCNIKCLKSLHLSCVQASKQFVEFILSSCPLLEDLSLHFFGSYNDLDVSDVPPLQLRRLKIKGADDFALAKLCAPYLTSFSYCSTTFNPQKIDIPSLTDLTIGSTCSEQSTPNIMKYLVHFWSYLPQLEKLELIMYKEQGFKLKPIPEMVKLKYLMIRVNWDTDTVFHRFVNFVGACPLLETLALEIADGGKIPNPISMFRRGSKKKCKKSCFKNLKALELYGGDGKTIDQEFVKIIIRKAIGLEKLMVHTRDEGEGMFPYFLPSLTEIVETVDVKAKKLCRGRCVEIQIK